jgi:uncharacterized protein YbjT (DUF2867 family)
VDLLVTGATGFVGRSLVPALVDAGHSVRAGTRHPERYDGPGDAVHVDLGDPATLGPALEGCDAAYFLVHGMAERGDFVRRDRESARSFGEAAAAAGSRVVYLGGLGAGSERARHSDHLRSRHEVGEVLRATVDTVELQAAIVIGKGSTAFEVMRQLVERLPVMVCPSWVTTRAQPIALEDIIRYLVAAPELPAGTYEVGGADVLTYEDMMRRYGKVVGRRHLLIKVPVLTPGLSSRWIGLVTDEQARVARALAEGLSVEVVVSDDRIRQLVPFEPMGFDEAVRQFVHQRDGARQA